MNNKKKYIDILAVAAIALLSACSSDKFEEEKTAAGNEPVERVVRMMMYSSPFAERELLTANPSAEKKLLTANPAGFSPYTPDKRTIMGVYMLLSENPETDWASPEEKEIIYTSRWNAYFEVEKDKTYTVYGYMPKTEGVNSSLTKSIADVATLTITGIKPASADDVCIITGVNKTDEGLKEGQFSWYTPVADDIYDISMLMDHIYAGVQFRMTIDSEYAKLRTIKLKKMELSTNKESVNAAIALTHNTTGTSPISSITYTLSDGSGSSTADIYNSNEGTALPTTTVTPLSVNAYFAPELSSNLTLVSTYDVYDSKGNLIRQNCTATNKLPDLSAVRGQRVLLNMTVNPTYLYVLSEPDLDSPTIKIN